MPTPEHILNSLSAISNKWQAIAVFWHVYFTVFAFVLAKGVRLPKRIAGILLALPFLSVSALAWLSGNPFSGITFALSGAALIIIATRLPVDGVRMAPWWVMITGIFMFAFGWVYPHFLDTISFVPYLYSAPTGLIPCPTISIVIGLSLIIGNLGSRAWSIVLGAMGIFYGIIGTTILSLPLDWGLLLGALMIVFFEFSNKRGEHKIAME